ncbi:hypothetical protein CIB48_g4695 [Xylaria polymorpha]|nr:hypothetical protein CIB48_g4695 [Xylaria polymorpha]
MGSLPVPERRFLYNESRTTQRSTNNWAHGLSIDRGDVQQNFPSRGYWVLRARTGDEEAQKTALMESRGGG